MLMPLSYRIRTLAHTFAGHLSGDARLDPSNTVSVAGRATPTLRVDGKVLNLDFTIPDGFTDAHAATATVFARMGDDFVRVTTSVRKEDGQRAIGTVLERSHPAYARLLSATPYVGYATIFGRQMMTHYDPMLSTGGEVIGARYVGLDVSGMRSITVPQRVGITVGTLCILGFVAFDWFARAQMPPMAQSAFFYFGIVMTLAMALASYALVERGVSRAMKHCAAAAGKIAAGDLSAQVPVNRRDDVGRLLQSINGISVGLTQVVGQVQSASDGILESSRQIASGTSDLSTRTQQQAAALEQTAAAMEQLSATVSQNSVHAGDANALVAKASTLAKDGTEIVDEVSRSMAAVRANAKRIETVVGLIDNIAFQSNILALNAAVEAARAGEHGRGFAVVATEVRGLAQQSAAAARDVKALIAASVDTVDTGCALVERSGESTRLIADAIRDASMLMNEIAAASSEQSKGIDEVKRAVTLMDDATQQNAALVEESAAAAMSMEEQASGMRRMVSAFRIAT